MSQELVKRIKKEKEVAAGEYVYTYKDDDVNYIVKTPKEQERYKYRYPELVNDQIIWIEFK